MPTRVAAIDIGSNTLHLTLADIDEHGQIEIFPEEKRMLVRLGADVFTSERISPERAAHAEQTLADFARFAHEQGATHLIGLATEVIRRAKNGAAMLERFSQALGAPIVLLSGVEEGILTFWGAASNAIERHERLALVDLGGGSSEVVISEYGKVTWITSLPLGSGQLIDHASLSTASAYVDCAALSELARAKLAAVAPPKGRITHLVGTGGVARRFSLIFKTAVPNLLRREELERALITLGSQPLAEFSATTGLSIERSRLLVGGVVAWSEMLTWLNIDEIHVSPTGLREGAIIAWARLGTNWLALVREAASAIPVT